MRIIPTCCGNVFPNGECRGYCAMPKEIDDDIDEPDPGWQERDRIASWEFMVETLRHR